MGARGFRMLRSAIPGVEAVEAESNHVFPRHTHDQFGIGVILSGAQKSASGRGLVEAGKGNVITVNPGEVHDGAPIGDSGRAWRMLYFEPALIADAMQDVGESEHSFEFTQPVIDHPRTASLFLQSFAAMTCGVNSPSLRREELFLLLVDAMRENRQKSGRGNSLGPKISAARASIDDAPAEPARLDELAQLCGLSRFQVLRGFAAATGFTPHAYLMQRRIDLARRLIARGTSLAEAAAASGFADQSHMTRLFSRNYGVSPGTYAAAIR